jgi:hypothetical protein
LAVALGAVVEAEEEVGPVATAVVVDLAALVAGIVEVVVQAAAGKKIYNKKARSPGPFYMD